VNQITFEDKFKEGLKRYIEDNLIKQIALAEKAGIRGDVFSRLLNTERRVYGDEIAGLCGAIGLTFSEIINYKTLDEKQASSMKAG
jgi:DNA-binding Xre family transcriptional regulator